MQDAAELPRCAWCGADPLYVAYHDEEWGVPVRDDQKLFEMLTLEGAQAGLSWITILRKREGYRRAFRGFDPQQVASMSEDEQAALMRDSGIVRNRLKISSTVSNARALVEVQRSFGSFSDYFWSFSEGTPIENNPQTMQEIPTQTPLSVRISKDLKKRGFRFVGPTIIYAFMQATGMVDDHLLSCFRSKKAPIEDAGRLLIKCGKR